jgi:four helix bundle suffix protein
MRLTDVARASLAELQGDYLNWLLHKEQVPWPQRSPEAQSVFSLRLDRPAYGEDVLHDAGVHILEQQRKFAPWLRSEDDVVVANALLILIGRVINMLNHQMESQGEKFQEEGGFREQLSVIRQEVMAKREQAPACPECGAAMRKRKAKSGKNVGQEFWGCSKFPACSGVRSL